jgi:Fur family transcriptional regulator, ferric uptake regulator
MSWVDEAAETLRGAGYRPGAAGQLVLEHLASQECCLGAKEIHEDLRRDGRTVGLASVYRMLEALSEQALVQRVDVGDGVIRYEPARHSDHHHHLVCEECGKVEPFADRGLERALEAVEERSGYSIAGHEVVVRGACADCRV